MELSVSREKSFSCSIGPGFCSTLPIIRIKCKTNRRNKTFMFGSRLWRSDKETTRNEQRQLVSRISEKVSPLKQKLSDPEKLNLHELNNPMATLYCSIQLPIR